MTNINLVPARWREKAARSRQKRRWIGATFVYALALCGVAAVAIAAADSDGTSLAADIAKTKQQIEQLDHAIIALKPALAEAQTKLSVARSIADQPDWSLLLAVLSDATKGDIALVRCQLSRSDGAAETPAPAVKNAAAAPTTRPAAPPAMKLALHGLGRTQTSVTDFVLRLEQTALFDRVTLKHVSKESTEGGGPERCGFEIECSLNSDTSGGRKGT